MSPELINRLANRLFDKPLVQNSFRGELVEELVTMALEPEWEHCGGDWGSWDLVRVADGLRIQVKQSAVRQSWHTTESPQPRPSFSIARKTGRWEGMKWIEDEGRNADIFVFGLHPIADESADHRDPQQWLFYVVAENQLPDQKSMALSTLRGLSDPVSFANIKKQVEAVAGGLSLQQSKVAK